MLIRLPLDDDAETVHADTYQGYDDPSLRHTADTVKQDSTPSAVVPAVKQAGAHASNDESEDAQQEDGDVEPASDDYYEDGEFVGTEEADATEEYDDDSDDNAKKPTELAVFLDNTGEAENSNENDTGDAEGQPKDENEEDVEEDVIVISDPNAPIEEAAEEAEAYEEAIAEYGEAAVAEGAADANADVETALSNVTPTMSGEPDVAREEQDSYHKLGTPTDEEVIFIERPGINGRVQATQASVVAPNVHLEENPEVVTVNGSDPLRNKRSREEINPALSELGDGTDNMNENDIISSQLKRSSGYQWLLKAICSS